MQNVRIHKHYALDRLKHIQVGNFAPSNENLYVGDLLGNQFQIILRDVRDATPEQVRL